jgi:hypothetical protein
MLLAALTALVLAGSACGAGESDTTVSDPGSSTSSSPSPSPSSSAPATPAPAGLVATRGLATVMDEGTGTVELCLGPIAESYPPQCGGPPIAGWDWAEHQDTYDEQGKIRWGSYALTGEWDGATFTATDAVSGALYDPAAPLPSPTPAAATAYPDAELEAIAEELKDTLPGYLGAYGGEGTDGHVLADVYYDDGSLQEWADATYGQDVVIVTGALVDAG